MPAHDRPDYSDVRWDHGAAAAAIAALRRAADEIERASADCALVAGEAAALWMGGHRATFDLRRRALGGEASRLAADCRAAAGGIAAADRRARDEQARRERERAEWERRERESQRHAPPRL